MSGRIDVHSHLLPGVDDGCQTLEDSLRCARALVAAGYSHCFCTPHIWPSFPKQSVATITQWVADLQAELDRKGIALRLFPGGEIGLRADLNAKLPPDRLLTFGLANRYCLVDIWADTLPEFFAPTVKWLQGKGLTVILAHPERMKAVQDQPELMDCFADLGLLLQGNLQCLGEDPSEIRRQLAERFLTQGKYFLLGSDLHNFPTLQERLDGLSNAIQLVGEKVVDQLTKINPRLLLPH